MTEVKDLRTSNDMGADNNKKLNDSKRVHDKTYSEGKRVTLDLQDQKPGVMTPKD